MESGSLLTRVPRPSTRDWQGEVRPGEASEPPKSRRLVGYSNGVPAGGDEDTDAVGGVTLGGRSRTARYVSSAPNLVGGVGVRQRDDECPIRHPTMVTLQWSGVGPAGDGSGWPSARRNSLGYVHGGGRDGCGRPVTGVETLQSSPVRMNRTGHRGGDGRGRNRLHLGTILGAEPTRADGSAVDRRSFTRLRVKKVS